MNNKVEEVIRFTKMHGCGNDYVFVDGTESCPSDLTNLSVAISDRHFGVGSDGLVVILPSTVADFRMRMFNADGSEGEMCGNASRCIGKFVYEKGLTQKHSVTLETLAGIKTLALKVESGEVTSVTVDMGEPILEAENIPVISEKDVVMTPIKTSQGEVAITAVSMGNPHGVIVVKDLTKVDVHAVGRELERHPIFPNRANIEFVQVLNSEEVKMRVWERGSGETLACGTGACATLVATALTGNTGRRATIHLLGGDLMIEWSEKNNHVYMTGPATVAFEGTYKYKRETV